MTDHMLSAGIDIGTSTTQLIFSRLSLANTGGFGSVPRVEIISKEILYRSPIHFTPLRSEDEIDEEGVSRLIRQEYARAGIRPEQLQTGAVIITGETARKRNARRVVQALSQLAGDFVVAAAGPDLESVLAGKGSGAAQLSRESGRLVVNLDIGGGTTNICCFSAGEAVDTACLNIGGRLLRLEDGIIRYCSPALTPILASLSLSLRPGDPAVRAELERLADRMAELLAEALGLLPPSPLLATCYTNHGLTAGRTPEILTFSGGVADCIARDHPDFAFGDLGVLLGRAIRRCPPLARGVCRPADETVSATVVGAGNFSMAVSGSTIEYAHCPFPMKNIPVFSVPLESAADLSLLDSRVRQAMARFYDSEPDGGRAALAFRGLPCPSFPQVDEMARRLCSALVEEARRDRFPVLVMEADTGKVLGQAIRRRIGREPGLLCLDAIRCREGDFLDIGAPAAAGAVVPVIVKTLIFTRQEDRSCN